MDYNVHKYIKGRESFIRKLILLHAILVLLLFLVACQSDNDNENNSLNNNNNNDDNDQAQNNNEEAEEEDPYPYSLDPYEIEVEPEGELFAEFIGDKETDDDDLYDEAETEAIDALKEKVQDLDDAEAKDPEILAGYIINVLRTNYQSELDEIRDFEIEYDDIELPDGRKLNTVKSEDLKEEPPETNVAVILDASGSMKAEVEGGEKMALARKSLKTFTDSLADYVNVSLYVFGHEGSSEDADKELSCSTIDNIYELDKYDSKKFDKALNSFDAKGWTPIADSLSLVRDDLVDVTEDEDTKNIIYLISDGIETCDGDPVEVVSEIKDDIDNVTINIIGFDVDGAADQLLKDIAEAGNGKYNVAQNEAQLGQAIEDQWHQKIDKTKLAVWGAHQTIDIQNRTNGLYDSFDKEYKNPLNQLNSREEKRLSKAVRELNNDELIDPEIKSTVNDIISERSKNAREHVREISTDKREKIKEESHKMKDILEEIEDELGD